MHVIRSLLHLTRHTQIYIPIAPYLLPILTSTLSSTSRPKSSTLKPLDLDIQIRTPQQYLKTRIYAEGLVEEVTYLLAEWLATEAVHGSVAFPEIVVPILIVLKKAIKSVKSHGSGKDSTSIKMLVERTEDSVRWTEQRRREVKLAPNMIPAVEGWERELKTKVDEAPLGKYVKVQRKTREKQRKLVQKVSAWLPRFTINPSQLFRGRLAKARVKSWIRTESIRVQILLTMSRSGRDACPIHLAIIVLIAYLPYTHFCPNGKLLVKFFELELLSAHQH